MALATLTVDLILKAGGFESDMNRASKSAQKRMKEIEQSARAAGAVIGTALAAGAGIAAAALKAAINSADRIDELSQSMGITAQQLSRLQLAAKFGAVDLETLGTAFGRLSKAQLAFSEGNKETVALFNALGVNGDVARNTAEVMQDLADVFARMPDSAQKTALAMELFGKAGANLIPFLNQGGDRIQELQEKADRLGITLSNETAKAAGDFNDQLDIMKFAAQGLAAQVAKELLPDMVRLTGAFSDNATQGDRVSGTAKDIAASFRVVGSVVGAVYNAMRYLGESFGAVIAQTRSYLDVAKQILSLQGWQNGQAGIKNAIGNAGMQYDLAFDSQASGGNGIPSNFTFVPPPAPAKAMPPGLSDYLSRNMGGASSRGASPVRAIGDDSAAAKRQVDEFLRSLEDLRAEMEGPAAEAQLEYNRQMLELQEILDAHPDLLEAVLEMQGLLTDKFLAGAEAVEKLSIAEKDLTKALTEQQLAQVDAMDNFRRDFEDNVAGVLQSTQSIGDAFQSMVDSIIAHLARMAAQQFAQSLFGGFGTPAGGGGGFLSGLMSLLPGFAKGTDYAPGGWAVVGEKGPEIVNLPRGSQVVPNHELGGRGTTINVNVAPSTERRTAQQVAHRVMEMQQLAFARNG